MTVCRINHVLMFVNSNLVAQTFEPNPKYDIHASSIYKPQIYNPLMVEKEGHEGDETRAFVRVRSDVELIKAEDWLIQEHPEVLQDFAKRAAAYRPSDTLNELRKNLSDDDLMLLIKSRHCQTPSEIEAFYNDLSQRNISYNECMQAILDEKQKQAVEAAETAGASEGNNKDDSAAQK